MRNFKDLQMTNFFFQMTLFSNDTLRKVDSTLSVKSIKSTQKVKNIYVTKKCRIRS